MTKLPRRWNHLRMIRSMLANLRGGGSLANELIQNADDAKGATRLVFRFTPGYLEVSDDGGFRACRQPNDPGACPWELAGERACDFHAFRELGGASKANDPSLTGAFGVGFLSVYQITDHPELFSRGIHWILDEEDEAVNVCDGCGQTHVMDGTTFRLPWARRPTRLREELGAEPVTADDRRRLLGQFVEQAPQAMIFLHQLREVEIADETSTIARFSRDCDDDKVCISGPAGKQEWLILAGDFNDEAAGLRRRHDLIGRRRAEVRIALSPNQKVDGRLYATLPTTIPTGLPLHLDSSFFPRLDRKGILLDSGYEAEWNNAAIAAAARLLAASIEKIAPILGPRPFWSLVNQAYALQRRRGGESRALAVFWPRLREALPQASVMWTRSEEWAQLNNVVMAPRDQELAGLFEDLDIPTISPLIQTLVPTRPLGIGPITLERLLDELEGLGLAEEAALDDMPDALRPEPRRRALRKELGALVASTGELSGDLRDRVRALPLWQGTDGRFSSFGCNWLVARDTVQPFAAFSQYAFVIWSERDASSKALSKVADHYTIDEALSDLERAAEELPNLPVREARAILAWFQSRLRHLSDGQVGQLVKLPLIPTEPGLRPASETVRAGGFRDPLGLTCALMERDVTGLEALVAELGIRKLSFAGYLREHVAALDSRPVPTAGLLALIRQCARHRDAIDADPALIRLLTELAWIPCQDGHRYTPGETYFSSPLVQEVLGDSQPLVESGIKPRTASADLLRLLGVADVPRPADVIAHIKEIVSEPPSERRIAQVVANIRYLSSRSGELDQAFAPLRALAWLPADGKNQWFTPSQLYLTFNQSLFATTGLFIALRRTDQERLRTTLSALGVRTAPPPELVVGHVMNLAAQGTAASDEVLRWLNDHAADTQIRRLAHCKFLPSADGTPRTPNRIFRRTHQLSPWRAVLRSGLDRFPALLDTLQVAPEPDAAVAAEVLTEISDASDKGRLLDRPLLKVVNTCWELFAAAPDPDLDGLEGRRVVPASDGQLRTADAVLLEDLPDAARWLTPAACARLVPLDGRQWVLERFGVARLSQRRRGELLASPHRLESHWIETRLQERRAQLARVIAAEGGDWRDVIDMTQNTVVAVSSLTVRYRLDGLSRLAENPAVEEGAFYDRDNGNLFVRVIADRPDWHALARVARDQLLPGFGPGVTLAIKAALAAQSADDADADLQDYPQLGEEVLAELRQTSQAQPAQHDDADRADPDSDDRTGTGTGAGDEVDDDEIRSDDDNTADAHGEAAEAKAGTGVQDLQGSNNNGDERRSGFGSVSDRQPGARQQGTVNGHSGDPANVTRSGPKPTSAGAKINEMPDSQLISYAGHQDTTKTPATDDERSRAQHPRNAIGEAGVDLVIAHLEAKLAGSGTRVEKMPANNEGYDVLVSDASGRPQRYIEVKTTTGAWGLRGVGLTQPEFKLAQKMRERYTLYVVEHLYQPDARIWSIDDPAGRVDHFHYDYGWQTAAYGPVTVPGATAAATP